MRNDTIKRLAHRYPSLRLLMPLLLLAATLLPFAATSVSAQNNCRTFPETGHTVCGAILNYWTANGGLPVFGYPRSAQFQDNVEGRTLQVQWFERDRLEIQPDGSITAGRLGAAVLESEGRYKVPGPDGGDAQEMDCQTFGATGYTACGVVLSYWRSNGGLSRFGFPISNLQRETIGGRTIAVQWFERRRVELHPHPTEGVQILLGLLGCQVSGLCPAS